MLPADRPRLQLAAGGGRVGLAFDGAHAVSGVDLPVLEAPRTAMVRVMLSPPLSFSSFQTRIVGRRGRGFQHYLDGRLDMQPGPAVCSAQEPGEGAIGKRILFTGGSGKARHAMPYSWRRATGC